MVRAGTVRTFRVVYPNESFVLIQSKDPTFGTATNLVVVFKPSRPYGTLHLRCPFRP